MPSERTRRSVLVAASLTTVAGCVSLVNDDDQLREGTTEGDGFSSYCRTEIRERRIDQRPRNLEGERFSIATGCEMFCPAVSTEFGAEATAPMVRYDAANTGAAPEVTGPSGSLTEQWATERTLGTPARPTALGETVFTNSVNGVCGFTTGGERRWAYDTNRSELNPAPVAVIRDRVYATRVGAVTALDAKIGDERWVFTPPVETNRLTAPAVAGDTVHVVGQHPTQSPTVWALATLDGSVWWHGELGGESAGPPVVTDGRLYCVTTNDGLYAVDTAEEGVTRRQSLTPTVGPPAATADGVFVGTRDGVVYYDSDGSRRWRVPETTALTRPHDGPVLDETRLYTAGPDGNSGVALEVETGEEQWRTSLSGELRLPVPATDSVYVQDSTCVR